MWVYLRPCHWGDQSYKGMEVKLGRSEWELRGKIIQVLKEQGFKMNPHVRPTGLISS